MLITPNNLPAIIARKTRSKEALRAVIKARLAQAIILQRESKMQGDRTKHMNLTEYANSLLDGKLLPLYQLVNEYTYSRMVITHAKHELLKKIRKERAANVRQRLQAMLISMYNEYRISGAIRLSDKKILNKFNG